MWYMSAMQNDLHSLNQLEVTYDLTDRFFEALRTNGQTLIAEQLAALRAVIWPVPEDTFAAQEKKPEPPVYDSKTAEKVFADVMESLKKNGHPDLQTQCDLMQAYAKMGHLYELAGLVARENLFQEVKRREQIVDGSAEDVLAKFTQEGNKNTLESIISQLNSPTFEIVMTAHPTNVNSENAIAALRRLGQAIDGTRENGSPVDSVTMRAEMRDFAAEALIPLKNNKPATLSVEDEISQTLYYLRNVYHSLPNIYRQFDDAIKSKFDSANPLDLDLDIRFASWGSSGDKDGNTSVTADTTLQAIAMHRIAILDCYIEDFGELGMRDDESVKALRMARERIEHIQHMIEEKNSNDRIRRLVNENNTTGWSPEEFTMLSQDLVGMTSDEMLDKDGLLEKLERRYNSEPENSARRQQALDLMRRLKTFGFEFARIEYRETAEQYTRVVAQLLRDEVPNYALLSEEEKEAKLTEILQEPGKAAGLYAGMRDQIQREGAGKKYSDDDAMPITYQTLKRMELARDHPGMITDNVLAECQQPSHMLEALFLQHAVEEKGRRPLLGIIPLFEAPEVMQNIDSIMERTYNNPVYAEHMKAVGDHYQGGEKTQQIQIAHSDNARRSGLTAARAFIYEAHNKLRKLGESHGITTQFFEGGSQSDPFRGGVRAVSAMINQYELFDFAKFTFQGGDLLNYLNYEPSIERLLTRNVGHCALNCNDHARGVPGERDLFTPANPVFDSIALEALKDTLPVYQKNIFNHPVLGVLLYWLNDQGAGNISSRAPSRGGQSTAPSPASGNAASAFAPGSVAQGQEFGQLAYLDPKKVRTITFSEILQHAGVVPTWWGTRGMAENLHNKLENRRPGKKKEVTPHTYHRMYVESPIFKDAIDRMAYGIAFTDFDFFRETCAKRMGGLLVSEENGKVIKKFIDDLEKEYLEASYLVCKVMGGVEPPAITSPAQARALVSGQIEHLREPMAHKGAYLEFLQHFSLHAANGNGHDWNDTLQQRLARLIHAAGDIVIHGRMLAADDPKAQNLRKKLAKADKLAEEKVREAHIRAA